MLKNKNTETLYTLPTWTMKSLNFLRWQLHSQGLPSICSCCRQNRSQHLKHLARNPEMLETAGSFTNLLKLVTFSTCGRGGRGQLQFSKKFSNWLSSEISCWISNRQNLKLVRKIMTYNFSIFSVFFKELVSAVIILSILQETHSKYCILVLSKCSHLSKIILI